MSNNPLVSVVIPAYNAAPFLTETLRSVLGQSYRPIEVLVADDGSRDGTALVAQSFGGPVRTLRQENRGPAAARNLGLRHASGSYAAFLDADDLWHPEKLAVQLRFMESHPQIGLSGTSRITFSDAPPRWATLPEPVPHVEIPRGVLILCNQFTASSVVARMECVRACGGFDDAMFGTEDWDLWLRIMARHGGARLLAPLLGYRVVPESVSANPARMQENSRKVIRKFFRENPELTLKMRLCALSQLHADAAQEWRSVAPWRAVWEEMLSLALWPAPMPFARWTHSRRHKGLVVMLLEALRLRRKPQRFSPELEEALPVEMAEGLK